MEVSRGDASGVAKESRRDDEQRGQEHAEGGSERAVWIFGQNGWEAPDYVMVGGRFVDRNLWIDSGGGPVDGKTGQQND